MTKSKLKKYVGKSVRVHFRHTMNSDDGIILYKPNEPLTDYFLYQPQYSSPCSSFYVALSPKRIGHVEIKGAGVN